MRGDPPAPADRDAHMDVTYRAARVEDLAACLDLFQESVSDMRLRHNLPSRPQLDGAQRLEMYRHFLSTGIFHVAEADGRLVAFASAIVRQHLWFLSGFWALPGMQQRHIGMHLLRGVWDAGRHAGATTFFVWSSIDLPAMAAYMKVGMLPGSQILFLEGTPLLEAEASLGYVTELLRADLAGTLDETVLGIRRDMDHDLLIRSGWHARQVMHAGQAVGYYYVHDGTIGPAAWTDAAHASALLTLACREAPAADSRLTLMIPGMNHAALRFGFDSGLRLTGFAHLLMSAPFGHLERYLPSGPGLF